MAIIIFLLWLLLNATFAWTEQFLQIVIFGVALTIIIYLFVIKFTKWTFEFDKFFMKHFFLFIAYGFVLFWNVIVCNFNVIKLILSKKKPEPEIIEFDVPIKNEILRVILSNSITLTPGTITIACHHDHFIVHCLRKEYFDGFTSCTLVKLLERMEAK